MDTTSPTYDLAEARALLTERRINIPRNLQAAKQAAQELFQATLTVCKEYRLDGSVLGEGDIIALHVEPVRSPFHSPREHKTASFFLLPKGICYTRHFMPLVGIEADRVTLIRTLHFDPKAGVWVGPRHDDNPLERRPPVAILVEYVLRALDGTS